MRRFQSDRPVLLRARGVALGVLGCTLLSAVPRAHAAAPVSPADAVAPPYDARLWLADLEQTRAALSAKYANLEWVVFEHETNLALLFADTQQRIVAAMSNAEARGAFDRLARRLGDGHVRFRWREQQTDNQRPTADCGALGYDPRKFGAPIAALIPGYVPLAKPAGGVFPAGILRVGAHRVGVIQIGSFGPEGFPALCAAAQDTLQMQPATPCDDACAERIETSVSARMTADLARAVRELEARGADVLLVDIANNGGGTEWAEIAARMVTALRLKSERVGFVRGEHWATAFAAKESALRAAAETADAADRALLEALAAEVAARREEAATPCDAEPFWRGEHPGCEWLGDTWFSSGVLDSDTPRIHGKAWAGLAFAPARYDYPAGAWRGPLLVLVNGDTASAAEEFAAILQDAHAALIIGAPTFGAGCGHTDGGTPTVLENSGGVLELPDCARFRADGSNEVMGIEPDLLVGLRANDGPHRAALRVAANLPEAVERALRLRHPVHARLPRNPR
jgi:hypothetical protein